MMSHISMLLLWLTLGLGASSPVSPNITSRQWTSSGEVKRGISYNVGLDNLANHFTFFDLVGWAYNWAAVTNDLQGGKDFVPMLWQLYSHSPSADQAAWDSVTGSINGATHLLSYNEPDAGGSGSSGPFDPGEAAQDYRDHVHPYGKNSGTNGAFWIGAPVVRSNDAGQAWMDSFVSACVDCSFDFFPVHWYGDCGNPKAFQDYLTGYRDRFSKWGQPLWVTEYGARDCANEHEETAFIFTTVNWLDAQDWIERYTYLSNGLGSCGDLGDFLQCPVSNGWWTCQAHAFLDPDGTGNGADMPSTASGLSFPSWLPNC